MSNVLLYYAHPGQRFSRVNKAMFRASQEVEGITIVDLYAEYPRFHINIDREQERLMAHDVIVFQHPLFWYSTPALVKEWIDLVLEHGFAYGHDGDKLKGKLMMQAISAAGPEDAYTHDGFQNFPLRSFLTPMEQTATLCKMHYLPPYTLYGALQASEVGDIDQHASGYVRLLEALRDNTFDFAGAAKHDVLHHNSLPIKAEA